MTRRRDQNEVQFYPFVVVLSTFHDTYSYKQFKFGHAHILACNNIEVTLDKLIGLLFTWHLKPGPPDNIEKKPARLLELYVILPELLKHLLLRFGHFQGQSLPIWHIHSVIPLALRIRRDAPPLYPDKGIHDNYTAHRSPHRIQTRLVVHLISAGSRQNAGTEQIYFRWFLNFHIKLS